MNQRLWVTTEGRGTDSGRPMMEEPAGEEQMVGFPFKGIHLRGGTRCGSKPLRVPADHPGVHMPSLHLEAEVGGL